MYPTLPPLGTTMLPPPQPSELGSWIQFSGLLHLPIYEAGRLAHLAAYPPPAAGLCRLSRSNPQIEAPGTREVIKCQPTKGPSIPGFIVRDGSRSGSETSTLHWTSGNLGVGFTTLLGV